jgi:hypothetical protein
MTNGHQESLGRQMQTVQNLYAELFMLLLESMEEPLAAPGFGGVDLMIEKLMERIDDTMAAFVGDVRRARDEGSLAPRLDGEIREFEAQLKDGLTSMHTRIQGRIVQMAREREDLKERLRLVQRKRTGTRGYHKGFVIAATAHDEPMEASA